MTDAPFSETHRRFNPKDRVWYVVARQNMQTTATYIEAEVVRLTPKRIVIIYPGCLRLRAVTMFALTEIDKVPPRDVRVVRWPEAP